MYLLLFNKGYASWDEFGHDNSGCKIPTLTVEEWEEGRYWEKDLPVIVQNVTTRWTANNNWKLSEMLKRYPDTQATMGPATLIGRKGPDSTSALTTTTIKEFITLHMYDPNKYLFDRKISIPNSMMEDCSPFPKPTRDFYEDKDRDIHDYKWRDHLTISIGSDKQGLTFHLHDSAWNIVLFGAKRWILWDRTHLSSEEQTLFSRDKNNGEIMTAAEWIRTLDNHPERQEEIKKNGHDCIQHAGDLLFIPTMVSHLVVNIGDTVAIVSEIDVGKGDTHTRKDIRRKGTRRMWLLDINPEPALILLNKLMTVKDDSKVLGILRHQLCPGQQKQATGSISPEGNVDLLGVGGEQPLISHYEFTEALYAAITQLFEAEAAGELNRLQKEKFLSDVGRMAGSAELVFGECFGENSDILNEYRRDLQDIGK